MNGQSLADHFGNMIPIVSTTVSSSLGNNSAHSPKDKHREDRNHGTCSTFVDSFANKNDTTMKNTNVDKILQAIQAPLETWSSKGTSTGKETEAVNCVSLLNDDCDSPIKAMNDSSCTFADKIPYPPTLERFSSKETMFSKETYTEEADTIADCDCVSPIVIVTERLFSPKSKQLYLTHFPNMPEFSSSLTMTSYTEYIEEENTNDNDDDDDGIGEQDDAGTFIESTKHMMKDDYDDNDGGDDDDDDCSFGVLGVVDMTHSLSLNHFDSLTAIVKPEKPVGMHHRTPTTPTTTATTTTKTTMQTKQSPFHESISSIATKNSSYPTRTASPKKQFKSLTSSLQHQQRLAPATLTGTAKTLLRHSTATATPTVSKHTTSNSAKNLVNSNITTTNYNNHNTTTNNKDGQNNINVNNHQTSHENGCNVTDKNDNQEAMLQRYEQSIFFLDDDGMMLNNNCHR